MTTQADLVVCGEVVSKSCLREARGHIRTQVEVKVAEAWKGTPKTQPLVVVLAGGTLGDLQVVLEGQPDYSPGEEVVLFLKLNPRGQAVTVGLAQGKLVVAKDPKTGERYARRDLVGSANLAGGGMFPGASAGDGRWRLDKLRQRVLAGKP